MLTFSLTPRPHCTHVVATRNVTLKRFVGIKLDGCPTLSTRLSSMDELTNESFLVPGSPNTRKRSGPSSPKRVQLNLKAQKSTRGQQIWGISPFANQGANELIYELMMGGSPFSFMFYHSTNCSISIKQADIISANPASTVPKIKHSTHGRLILSDNTSTVPSLYTKQTDVLESCPNRPCHSPLVKKRTTYIKI